MKTGTLHIFSMQGAKPLKLALLCILFFSFTQINSFAETTGNKYVDSLITALGKVKTDTARLNTLIRIADEAKYIDLDIATSYAKQAETLATKVGKEISIAQVNFIFGYLAYARGDFAKANEFYETSASIYKKLNDKEGIAKILYHSGIVYVFIGNYSKANSNFFEALKMYEALGLKRPSSNCIIAIGNVYGRQGNTPKELEYHLKGLALKKELNDESGICAALINIGNVYSSLQKNDTALDYYTRALALAEKLQNQKWIVNSVGNIGMLYANMGDPKKALEYMNRSLKISEAMKDKQAMTVDYFTIGGIYAQMKENEKAKEYLNRSLELAHETGNIVDEKNAFEQLSDLFATEKQYKDAYTMHKKFTDLKDSIFRFENAKQFAEMGTQYETEKKDTEIKLLNKDKEVQSVNLKRQTIIIWCVAAGLLIVVSLAFFVFHLYRQKNKTNIALEQTYRIIEEKNKDITDSINYAKKIQTAMLPSLDTMRTFFSEISVLYKPKDIVSGDFYWFNEKKGDLFLAVADCTGHGVPGAFMSMIGNDLLTHIIIEKGIVHPDQILALLHDGVQNALKQNQEQGGSKDGMDISIVRLSTKNNTTELQYAGALRPLWLLKKGENALLEYKPDKFSIGGSATYAERKFTLHTIQMNKGDSFFLSTDGYADQFGGADGKKLMTKNMKELLFQNREKDIETQKQILEKNLSDWKGNREQVDDILVIGARI